MPFGPAPLREILRPLRSDPFVLFMFLSLLLIGADLIAIRSGGITLRIVFPTLMATFAFLYLQRGEKIYFDPTLTFLFLLLALAGTVSLLGSYDATKSVGYIIWVLFDFFVIITLAYNFARRVEPNTILSLWFLVYRIHVVLLLCEVTFNLSRGTLGRPHVWFYESSYLAIFLTGYFGAALYMFLRAGRGWLPDFALSFVGLLATTSATGIFGMMFAILLNFVLARQRLWLMFGAVCVGAIFVAILYLLFRDTVYYHLIVGFLLHGEFDFNTILNRGGNRVVRALVGWSAFQHHPWTGIGIGGDAAYMDGHPYPEVAWRYIHSWTDLDTGQPFSNIIIEVLGTMGIAGFIPFAGILFFAIFSVFKVARSIHQAAPFAIALFVGFFSIFLALQFESTFLRYYLWCPLGLAIGLWAQIRNSTRPEAPPPAAPTC